jgi:hypothetical protein
MPVGSVLVVHPCILLIASLPDANPDEVQRCEPSRTSVYGSQVHINYLIDSVIKDLRWLTL